MKLRSHCVVCMQDKLSSGATTHEMAVTLLAIRDDGKYDLVCPEGHEYALVVQGTKYEVLFEIALNAYRDGYYREAISSFSASLERFYEFFLHALFHFSDRTDYFRKNWRRVKSASERQLGAYIFCSALHFGCDATILQQKYVELRNNVVHKGYIPQPDEVLSFGQEVCDIIVAGLDQIYEVYGDNFREFYYSQMPKLGALDKPVLQYVMIGIRWEDVKTKDSKIRNIRNSLERMFGLDVV